MANQTSSSIGFSSLLLLVFIALKLTKNIDWSWFWVLSPFWIPLALALILLLVGLFIGAVADVIDYFNKKTTE